MYQLVAHSGLVDRERLGRQLGLQAVGAERPRRHTDERRDRPQQQKSLMHASTCGAGTRGASPELAQFGLEKYIRQAPRREPKPTPERTK